jgi:hypothetical protein
MVEEQPGVEIRFEIDDEAQAGLLSVKSLRVEREQVRVSLSEACETIKNR